MFSLYIKPHTHAKLFAYNSHDSKVKMKEINVEIVIVSTLFFVFFFFHFESRITISSYCRTFSLFIRKTMKLNVCTQNTRKYATTLHSLEYLRCTFVASVFSTMIHFGSKFSYLFSSLCSRKRNDSPRRYRHLRYWSVQNFCFATTPENRIIFRLSSLVFARIHVCMSCSVRASLWGV